MRLLKIISSFTFLSIVLSQALSAQFTPDRIPRILERFSDGLLTANEAIIEMKALSETGQLYKCATPIHAFAHQHKSEISPSLLSEIQKNKSSSAASTYLSPSGKFEFTYETTGQHAVPTDDANTNGIPDYVERAAQSADYSYQKQVHELGFPDPIVLGTTYKISFRDMSFYGLTETDVSSPSGTRIILENDFEGFAENDDPEGDQYGALKVTMAHEFKHAIQYKQNNFSGDSDKWAEMDATLLEEVTYDEVNDYYNYLNGLANNPFNNSGVTVIPGSYEDITWALFFSEYFDEMFWTGVWERIDESLNDLEFLVAVQREVEEKGENFDAVLSQLYLWHYSSGNNTVTGYGFEEAENYPNPAIEMNFDSLEEVEVEDTNILKLSSHYYELIPNLKSDQIKIDLDYEQSSLHIGVHIYFKDGSSDQKIYVLNESGNETIYTPYFGDEIRKIALVFVNTDSEQGNIYSFKASSEPAGKIIVSQNYPNPFNPQTIIPIRLKEDGYTRLEIFDYNGRLVSKVFDGALSQGLHEFTFDASNLASGVYLYKVSSGGVNKIKKMSVIK